MGVIAQGDTREIVDHRFLDEAALAHLVAKRYGLIVSGAKLLLGERVRVRLQRVRKS